MKSGIEGLGVFADEDIREGSIVWRFDSEHDKSLFLEDFEKLDIETKAEIRKVAYISPTSGKWVYPPQGDPACYTNHSRDSNNLSVRLNRDISEEPYFVANKAIKKGEELTNNYSEFDDSLKKSIPGWMQ